MRTFHDAKLMAKILRQAFVDRKIEISHSEILEIIAGSKAVARAVDQHHPDRRIAIGGGERIRHRAVHLLRERVLLLGPRDLDAQDAILRLGFYHAGSL